MIPTELTERRQWGFWKYIDGNKIPKQANGQNAKSNDSSTWKEYDDGVLIMGMKGLAFFISADDPYTGVDLDNCLDEKGMLLPWALPIVAKLEGVSFGEISPSGRGIKFLTRGKKPDGARCKKIIDADLGQQIEVYDHARFWTITENLYCNQLSDGQAVVDHLCEVFLSPSTGKPDPLPDPSPELTQADAPSPRRSPLDVRAAGYVNGMQPAVEGGRNEACFKLAGQLLSIVDESGNRLSHDEIVAWVRHYNSTLANPLPDAECWKAARSGLVNGSPREDKLVRESYVSVLDSPPEPPKPVSQDDAKISMDLIENAPGILSDIYAWFDETCLYQLPEVFLGSALALMSLLTGRKISGPWGARTNMYLLSMAKTGAGKEHGRSRIKHLFKAIGAESLLSPESFASAAGLISMVETSPAILFQVDEFGQLMISMNQRNAPAHLQGIESELLKLYSSSGDTWVGKAYANAEKLIKIYQPHVVINGTCTPSTLWGGVTTQQVHSGLFGRLQIFENLEYAPLKRDLPKDRDAIPKSVMDFARFWINYEPKAAGNLSSLNPRPTVMDVTQEAWDRLETHMRDIAETRIGEEDLQAAIWSRSAEKAVKLAMVSGAAHRRFSVTLQDADWAIRLQNELTRKMIARINDNVAENANDRVKKRLLAIIKTRTRWTLTQLRTRTQQFKNARERNEMLDELEGAGLIIREKEILKGPGRPIEWIRAAETQVN